MEGINGGLNAKLVEELQREGRAANRKDRERAELFEGMLKSPAWLEYVALVDSLLQACADQLVEPASGMDGLVKGEYIKGTMKGLLLAKSICEDTIKAIKQLPRLDAEEDD